MGDPASLQWFIGGWLAVLAVVLLVAAGARRTFMGMSLALTAVLVAAWVVTRTAGSSNPAPVSPFVPSTQMPASTRVLPRPDASYTPHPVGSVPAERVSPLPTDGS